MARPLSFINAWLARSIFKEREGSPDAIMSYDRPGDAHMGPIPLRGNSGTVTSEQRNAIWHATGVSVSVRWRQQWGARCLSLSGPADQLGEAKRLADEAIRANGTEGGRARDPSDGAELSRQVSQVASSQSSMWASMQAMTGRIALLENQVVEAQQAAAAAYAAAAAAQNAAHQAMLQRKKKRKKDSQRKNSSDEEKKGRANPAEASAPGLDKAEKEPSEEKPEEKTNVEEKTNAEEKAEPPAETTVKKELSEEEGKEGIQPVGLEGQKPCSPTSDANRTDVSESEAEDSPASSVPTVLVDQDGNPIVPVEGLALTELKNEEAQKKLDD